jgi:threonine-phosphate decarboxylase
MLNGHGGNIVQMAQQLNCAADEINDMSSNVNPLGPPPGLMGFLKKNIGTITTFPEVDGKGIVKQFADQYNIDPRRVLAGNGTTQFIYAMPQALEVKRALILGPTYSDYADACHLNNVRTTFAIAPETQNFYPDLDRIETYLPDADSVYICNPNNPTGAMIPMEELHQLCNAYPKVYFIVDESYLPFTGDDYRRSICHQNLHNVIGLSSISKIFAIPGLRIGFVISSADIIQRFRRFLQPWSVNSLAQLAVDYLMNHKDEVDTFIEKTKRFVEIEKNKFYFMLNKIANINLFPSTTNFILARLRDNFYADEVRNTLAQNKILVRNCQNFHGLSNRFIRISMKTEEVNQMLTKKLADLLQDGKHIYQNVNPNSRKRITG